MSFVSWGEAVPFRFLRATLGVIAVRFSLSEPINSPLFPVSTAVRTISFKDSGSGDLLIYPFFQPLQSFNRALFSSVSTRSH